MSDLHVKLVTPPDSRLYEQKTSSYLLDVSVLEDLKEAIRNAKSTNSEHPDEK